MKKRNSINRLVEELREIKLVRMAGALEDLYISSDFDSVDHLTLLEQIIEPEYEARIAKQYENRLKLAHLSGGPQVISNCRDSKQRCYLPKGIVDTLSSLDFIREGLNICILGPSDSGKSYLAKAIGIQGCQRYRISYYHCESFLEEMVALKASDYKKYQKKMMHNIKLDLLILDDFLLHTITDEREIKVLFELLEKRSELSKSTIVCSQREPKSWKSMILNDEVSSNAIMKRATKHYTVVIKPS
jgi:DNA replication protein DnaC